MMSKEAMKLALEALTETYAMTSHAEILKHKAITALREALAQRQAPYKIRMDLPASISSEAIEADKLLKPQPAQQEPVAWTLLLVGAHNGLVGKAGDKFVGHPEHYERVDVYTSPPAQRKPLTDEELDAMFSKTLKGKKLVNWVARAIEAAHGIKENT